MIFPKTASADGVLTICFPNAVCIFGIWKVCGCPGALMPGCPAFSTRILSMSLFLLKVVLTISPCPPWLVPMAYGLSPCPAWLVPMAYGLWLMAYRPALHGWCLWPMAYGLS